MKYRRNSLQFDVLEFGSGNKKTVVLLHGFPAGAQSWTATAEYLADQGFHVFVPEQRGYLKHARPERRRDYKINELVGDIAALLDAASVESAHIVGHDWGGMVAWAFADKYPGRTLSLTAISVPHPKAFLHSLVTSKQAFLSWYIGFFQLPWLPERFMLGRRGDNLAKSLASTGLDASMASLYAQQMRDTNRLTGALNWYRAMPLNIAATRRMGKIQPPTMFIYGKKDNFISQKAILKTKDWVVGKYTLVESPEETHWIPEKVPEWLAERIIHFINN